MERIKLRDTRFNIIVQMLKEDDVLRKKIKAFLHFYS